MIIENTINKEQMERSINLIIKYSYNPLKIRMYLGTALIILGNLFIIASYFKEFRINYLLLNILSIFALIYSYWKIHNLIKKSYNSMNNGKENLFSRRMLLGDRAFYETDKRGIAHTSGLCQWEH